MRWSSCGRRAAGAQHAGDDSRALRGARCRQPEPLAVAALRSAGDQFADRAGAVGGFYYKTFMWPASFWEKVYEPLIRRAAGLGRASAQEDPDIYEKAFLHCDVLVVGGGPAGLMAALAAGGPARASCCATRTFAWAAG
jgi:hypothetical protein